jgi:Helix-turn-helix domain
LLFLGFSNGKFIGNMFFYCGCAKRSIGKMSESKTVPPIGGQITRFNRTPEALFDYPISDGAFKLYVILNSYCWTGSECWVSRELIASRMRRSVRQISRLLQELEREHLIEIKPPTPTRLTNTYRLMLWIAPQSEQLKTFKKSEKQSINRYGGLNDGGAVSSKSQIDNYGNALGDMTPKNRGATDKAVPNLTLPGDNFGRVKETDLATPPVTTLSPETDYPELEESKHTTQEAKADTAEGVSSVCAGVTENPLKPPINEKLNQVLLATGISNQVLPRATKIISRSGRTLAEVESLIKAVKENSRIQNPAAYILKMIELDLYPETVVSPTSQNNVSLAYPFGNFAEGFDDNPRAIETRIKNLRDRNALKPEREQELMAKLEWARQYQATKPQNREVNLSC